MNFWLALGAAYLVGAIPASYLAGRSAGIDLREHGSKNLGATNLYRVLGLKYAVPVALFDMLKGAAPVWFLAPVAAGSASPRWGAWVPMIMGLGAVVGHVYPVYLRFNGGKGVATAAGVMIGLAPVPFLASAISWGGILGTTRIMSLASIAGALVFPVAAWMLMPENTPVLGLGTALAAFILFTHRANIGRLLKGTEPRLGKRAASGGDTA